MQEYTGAWANIEDKVGWKYFQKLSPALILQRAKMSVLQRDQLPDTANAAGECSLRCCEQHCNMSPAASCSLSR
jgi:hypothetical protein